MELKVLMKVGLFVFLLGLTATTNTVDGRRFDPSSFISELFTGGGAYSVKSTTTACCDACYCTKSIPPQCHCADVGTSCHSACEACICTRSIPPICRCADTNDFCYEKCSSSSTTIEAQNN